MRGLYILMLILNWLTRKIKKHGERNFPLSRFVDKGVSYIGIMSVSKTEEMSSILITLANKEKRNCDSIYNDSSKKKKGECVVTANIRIPYGIFISDC